MKPRVSGSVARLFVGVSLLSSATVRADEPAGPTEPAATPTAPAVDVYSILPSQAPVGPRIDLPQVDAPKVDLPADPYRTRRHVGMGMVAGGLGLVVVSGFIAHDIQQQVNRGEITALRGHDKVNYYANSTAFAGWMSIGIGATLWLTSRKPERTQVGLVPTRGGSALAVSGQF